MITQCYFCGGTPVQKSITAENWWGDRLALVEDAPAWVCDTCGEVYFDAETARRFDDLRRRPPQEQRVVAIPVYAFAETARSDN